MLMVFHCSALCRDESKKKKFLKIFAPFFFKIYPKNAPFLGVKKNFFFYFLTHVKYLWAITPGIL